jgi:hypothetical protein
MGRTLTPKYSLEASFVDFANKKLGSLRMGWPSKLGKPTNKKAEAWVRGFNESLKPGGANAHLRATQSDLGRVTVRYNVHGGLTVAEYSPPLFQIL